MTRDGTATHAHTCSLFVWLVVLVCSERKALLAGYCWLVCSERKILLAGG
jgi:hypothetical protein